MMRNPSKSLHPFERGREYVRALNSVKLQRMFAKPLVASLDLHGDGVYTMSRHPKQLPYFLSGDASGELIIWNLITQ